MGSRTSSSSRSHSPGSSSSVSSSSSTTVSTESGSSSYDDSSVEGGAPAGSFDIGLTKAAPTSGASKKGAASTEPVPIKATTHDTPSAPANSTKPSRPACPRPVLILIRSLALVLVGGGLSSTIYGGINLMTPDDPQRGAHIGILLSGVVEMVIGLVVGMSTLNDPRSPTPPSHPPSHPA